MVNVCEHENSQFDSYKYTISNVKKSKESWNGETDKTEITEKIVNINFTICDNCHVLIFQNEEIIEEKIIIKNN